MMTHPYMYQYPYLNVSNYNYYGSQPVYPSLPNDANYGNQFSPYQNVRSNRELTDYGNRPFVVNINQATKQNNTFRTALWTGKHLQLTLMSIGVGEDIGLERHNNLDQFLRVEQGQGMVQMGKNRDNLDFKRRVFDDSAILIPAGTWHNLTNTGNVPLKLYSIYAPPNHPFGTVHKTKADAMAMEEAAGHGGRGIHFPHTYR